MALKAPTRVESVVVISVFIENTAKCLEPIMAISNTRTWAKETYDNYIPVYGSADALQQIWDTHLSFYKKYADSIPSGYWMDSTQLAKIHCPILMFHGDLVIV